MTRTIFFVSDSTGITAETLGHTLLTQFDSAVWSHRTLPFVGTPDKARAAALEIEAAAHRDRLRPIVFSTLVDPEARALISGTGALVLDLFSAFLVPLEKELKLTSASTSGLSHGMADRVSYDVRMEAVNFALQHDDGIGTGHYDRADIVLVGVSRSGKTPTSLYLAMQYGIRAANYPITPDEGDLNGLPRALLPCRQRLYGLTIHPDRLHQIRSERRPGSDYASVHRCTREIAETEALLRLEGVRCLDTSNKSIEEIASTVIQNQGLKRRLI